MALDISLFSEAAPATLRLLEERALERRYSAGATVWRAGEPPRGLHVLLSGRARVVGVRDGREVVLHHVETGATLGEVPLLDGGGYPATLRTETEARFLVVERALLERMVATDPAVAFALLGSLSRRIREMAGRMEALAADPVRTRLLRHLEGRASQGSGPFTLGMTQERLARELGTVREVVARTLGALVSDGTLERVGRGRYRFSGGSREGRDTDHE